MALTPTELAGTLPGLLGFPLTPFDAAGAIDEDVLREHVEALLGDGVSGIFPACGTGEFFSLSRAEYEHVVRACSEQVGGRVPVVAGLGYGGALALELAERGVRAGADGFLVMPPYLVVAGQAGLEAHYALLAERIPRGLILYRRDNAVLDVETVRRLSRLDTIVGLKDGIGRTEDLARLSHVMRDTGLLVINGTPTAEMHALTFAAHGVTTYSSAILCFLPEVAKRFHAALVGGDRATLERLHREAIVPLCELRARDPGYAIAMVKAGARIRGVAVGAVRPPLTDLAPDDLDALRGIVRRWRVGA
jgi:5-dehydro-4-deoxyglucarate dehydratase